MGAGLTVLAGALVLSLPPGSLPVWSGRARQGVRKGTSRWKARAVCGTHPTGTKGEGICDERSPRHPPGFCHSPSCPPNPHQIPSGGRIQCHSLLAPCEPRGKEQKSKAARGQDNGRGCARVHAHSGQRAKRSLENPQTSLGPEALSKCKPQSYNNESPAGDEEEAGAAACSARVGKAQTPTAPLSTNCTWAVRTRYRSCSGSQGRGRGESAHPGLSFKAQLESHLLQEATQDLFSGLLEGNSYLYTALASAPPHLHLGAGSSGVHRERQ